MTKLKQKPKSDNKKPLKLPDSKPSYSEEEALQDKNSQLQSLDDIETNKKLKKYEQLA